MLRHAIAAFRAPNPLETTDADEFDVWNPTRHIYSRYTQNVSGRAERVLSKINVSVHRVYSLCSYSMLCFRTATPSRSLPASPPPTL